MQHDEMIWGVINHHFCSFKTTIGKAKSDKTEFCKNPYSNTGLCNRTSCPLANSKYATIREDNGRIYLCVKTVERAHSPKNLWEKILLSRSNYARAIEQIDEHLQYFPKVIVHRNKQRLTKIYQYLIRMRKIELRIRSGRKAKMVRVHRKIEQREERRERKALVAARIEKNIEQELTERLVKGTYGDLYNFPETSFQKALQNAEDKEDEEETEDLSVEEESEEDDEEEMDGVVEYVEDLDSEEEDEMEDMEDLDYLGEGQWGIRDNDDDDDDEHDEEAGDDSSSEQRGDSDSEGTGDDDDDEDKKPSSKRKKDGGDDKKQPPTKRKQQPPRRRGPRIEIEYEEEREDEHQEAIAADSHW